MVDKQDNVAVESPFTIVEKFVVKYINDKDKEVSKKFDTVVQARKFCRSVQGEVIIPDLSKYTAYSAIEEAVLDVEGQSATGGSDSESKE